jgi:Short C-terminal domain
MLDAAPGRMVCKEVSPQVTSFTWSAKLEVLIAEDEGGSFIQLNGSIAGMGPVQKGHLRGQLGALKNNIEVEAESHADAATPPHGNAQLTVSEELEKLGDLHSRGVLSDQEFVRAKARLLG